MGATVIAQQAGSATMANAVSCPRCRVSGRTRYLHTQGRVVPCQDHTETRQKWSVIMYIPIVVCGNDWQEMMISRTGVVIEMLGAPGHRFKVLSDIFACAECGSSVAVPARAAIVEGYQKEYGSVSHSATAALTGNLK